MTRQTDDILTEFADAADRLAAIAGDWRQRQFKAGDITDAAHQVEGLKHLLTELRQGDPDGSR